MQPHFPADVSLRVSGEIADAQKLFPAAKQLLFRALKMQETGSPLVRLFLPGADGSLIHVFLHRGLKHVYVQPAAVVGMAEEPIKEQAPVRAPYLVTPKLLSGIVDPGSRVLIKNDKGVDESYAHEFHPTAVTSAVYGMAFEWKDNKLIGVVPDPAVSPDDLQVHWPKPSMYSGAMKRVVQVIYGMKVQNHYDYRWLRTDGIRKVGNKFWLVRISKSDGVLAMPLPMFPGTRGKSFKTVLKKIGDTETLSVVNEFDGIPNGATFPSDAHLENAIEDGKVLRLLSASDIQPFYRYAPFMVAPIEKKPYFDACGWAFSNTGAATEAHNTCWFYSREDIAFADWWEGGWYFDGHMGAPPEDRFMRGEHWKITIDLVNATAQSPASGVATLALVEMQPVEAPNCFGIDSYGFSEKMAHWKKWDAFLEPGSYYEADEPYFPFGAGIYGGTTDLGYGLGPEKTRFRTSDAGYPAYGNHGSGGTGCLPWRSDIYSPHGEGHTSEFHAITGPGQLTIPESPRLAQSCVFYGFNPLDHVGHLRTVFDHTDPNNVANSHAVFWTHRALMLVPKSTATSTLDRFKFWGRSLCSVPLDEMEPAYAAPVHVFYIGETLEIVRRQAERWKAGQYTMGDFWATSLDLRMNSTYTTYETAYSSLEGDSRRLRYIAKAPNPEGHIGLIIPQGVREGYVLLRSIVQSNPQVQYDPLVYAETKPVGVFAINSNLPKIVEYTNYAWDGNWHQGNFFGTDGTIGLLYDVYLRWDQYWTSEYFGPQIKMAVSLNAQTGEFLYSHDGPMRDWNPFNYFIDPFRYPEYVLPPTAIPRDGYPRYTVILPGGITLPAAPSDWGTDPVNVTFVGAI